MRTHWDDLKIGLRCRCPKCATGDIFPSSFSLSLKDVCDSCGLDLSKNDNADGPAVFLIFILGFLLVPLALVLDFRFEIPLWGHAVGWTFVTLGLTLGGLRPLKAYIMALQYHHRPRDWE